MLLQDRFRAFIRSWRKRGRLHNDMDDEMRFHIEQYRSDLMKDGLAADEADRRARRAFGNIGRTQQDCREAKGVPVFDELARNIVYAFRQLKRAPGFAAAVVLTLGLCMGVNTAVFGVIDAALLRAVPYPQPDRLFDVMRQVRNGGAFFASTGQDGRAWEALKDARTMRTAATGGLTGVNLGLGTRSFYVQQQRVSARYFSVLGTPLAYGREFDEAEDRAGGPDAAVLSYHLWKRFFNSDPSIVGRTILLRGAPYLVAGVAGESFASITAADVWTPLRPTIGGEGGGTNYGIVARLNPGVTFAEAQAEVQSRGAGAYDASKVRLDLAPFDKTASETLRRQLMILWAAAGAVLLIGCVNIAALMLARGATRRREMGTRMALGGGAGPLIRQLTTESLVLGLLGGIVGAALGYAALRAMQVFIEQYGIWQAPALDARVLIMTAIASLGVSLLFGLAPALQAVRVDVRTTLLEGGSRAVAGGGGHWFRRVLVLTEVALSLMLAVGAGLLVRTLLHLEHLDPGFDGTNVMTASASMLDVRYKDAARINRLYRESLAGIRATPGVEAAAVGLHVPYQRWLNSGVKVRRPSAPDLDTATSMNYITPGYFEALRIPVRSGRVFDERDNETSLPVIIVNETFARKFLKESDPLDGMVVDQKITRRIVGVVSDLQQVPGLQGGGPIMQEPAMYLPVSQFPAELFELVHNWFAPSWIVRANTAPQQLTQAIEQAIAHVDPLLPVAHFRSMVDERNNALRSQRSNAWLLGLLAALAVGLALVGVYGIVANSVVERTREFGIRMALGSSLSRVVWDAISPGIALALAGILIGGLLAAAAVTALKSLLYGVEPLDPLTFASTAGLLIAVSAAASLLPAIVLTRLEPSSVLRQD